MLNNKKTNKWNITKEFIIEEYINKKKSLPNIAKEIGMPYETLFYYKKRFGIPSNSVSFWLKGKRISPKTEFKKGMPPWNKSTKGIVKAWNKGLKLSAKYKKKVSIATKKAMNKPEIKEKTRKTQFKKGIIPWNKNKSNVYSKNTINKIRKARLKQKFPKKNTNIELILFKILRGLNVDFHKHKAIKMICQAGAFIKPNVIIFADGDYWHCNPRSYNKPKTLAQIKNLERDKRTNIKLTKEGYIVKRLWEHDLINNREICKENIKKILIRGKND